MSEQQFSEEDLANLTRLLVQALRGPLVWPVDGETEVPYSARVLRPVIAQRLEELQIRGLQLLGGGATAPNPVGFLGRYFYPDFAISYARQRLIAIEVKFLRDPAAQNPIATAIGQATIYREGGFPSSIALLLDVSPQQHGKQETAVPTTHGDITVIERRP